jgi:hypothetical protein
MLAERYALEVFDSITASGTSQQRVYGDTDLKRAHERHGRKVADVAIDYGDAWVVAEVTTSQLTRRSVAGQSDEPLVADLDKLVGEVAQIHDTIAALREDESSLTNSSTPQSGRRFLPLLVVAEGFPVNPISLTLLRQRVRDRGLLTEQDTGPLEVVDVTELEIVEGLQEIGGPSLRELLEGKSQASFANMALRDYVLIELELAPPRPQRIENLFREAFRPALDALGDKGDAI